MKIAFYQTAFLGDLLLAVPALRRIKEWQPQSQTTLICRQGLAELMGKLPFIDQVVEVNKKDKKSLADLDSFVAQNEFSYYFSPHYSYRSHMLSMRVQSEVKIGFKYWWNSCFVDQRVKRPMHLPDALRQMSLLSQVDELTSARLEPYMFRKDPVKTVEPWASMTMPREFWESQNTDALPHMSQSFVCLAPGSVWATKRWTREGFIEVGKFYRQQGVQVFLVGSPEEQMLCKDIAQVIGGQSFAGELTLWQTVQLLQKAIILFSNDSGAQHMASLTGTPTVSVFGPTVLKLGYQPWQNQTVVVENPMSCRPCGKHGGNKCPIGTHECMKSIKADQVLAAANRLLNP